MWLQEAATIRAQEKHRQEVLEFLLEVCFPRMQWQYPSLWHLTWFSVMCNGKRSEFYAALFFTSLYLKAKISLFDWRILMLIFVVIRMWLCKLRWSTTSAQTSFWKTVGFSLTNVSVTQSPTCSTESMAQTHLQKTPLGNAIKTCHISVLSISLSIDLSLFLRNSSQFTLQGLEQPSAGAFNHSALETQWAAAGQGLTFIGYQVDGWLSRRQFSILPQLRYVFYSIDTFTLHSQVGFFSQDSTNSGNVHTGTTMDECRKDLWQKKRKV